MSGSVAFDTSKFVETLEAGGLDRRQAKAAAEATSQALATKSDLSAHGAALRTEILAGRTELKVEPRSPRSDETSPKSKPSFEAKPRPFGPS